MCILTLACAFISLSVYKMSPSTHSFFFFVIIDANLNKGKLAEDTCGSSDFMRVCVCACVSVYIFFLLNYLPKDSENCYTKRHTHD